MLRAERSDHSTGIDNDIYSTVDACPNACEMWKAIERLKQGESINVQDLETNLYWEFGKFTSRDGESLESYYFRTQQSTRNRGKAIVTSSAPTYDPEPATKIYKPNQSNNLRTSSNPPVEPNQEILQELTEGTGAQLQEDTPDSVDTKSQNLEPIYDMRQWQKGQTIMTTNMLFLPWKMNHPEQPESSNDIYLTEQGGPNILFDCSDICYYRAHWEQQKESLFTLRLPPSSKKTVTTTSPDLTWTHILAVQQTKTPGVSLIFLTLQKEGIRHETSTARTPEQNGVVERRNRTLVEAARTMLSAAKVPLFFWAEAIATACFTQNRSLIIPRHEKTPYHIINARKPSVKFFHIFGSLCYIIRDGENLDKMKEKGDACIFVGYSTQSKAYRVFNKRTRMIVETIHVNFDELPQMASDHVSSDPAPQCSTMERTSSDLNRLDVWKYR
ncbi:retrovirus-related pol polyprotein from transposon TNT 1-94 [Tanacetum coccineum]